MIFTKTPDGLYHGDIPIVERWEEIIQRELASKVLETTHQRKTILELGYGLGMASQRINELNPQRHVIVEFIPDLAENARRIFPNTEVVCKDWREYVSNCGESFTGIVFEAYPVDQSLDDLLDVQTRVISDALPYLFPKLESGGKLGFLSYSTGLVDNLRESFSFFNSFFRYPVELPTCATDSFAENSTGEVIILVK